MKAIVYRKNGLPNEVLTCEEIDKPSPKEGEVLIKVHAAAVNPLDYHLMQPVPFPFLMFFRGPKIKHPGVDVAGVIESLGPAVTQFKPGDAVFGNCQGAFAEYTVAPESKLAIKPENTSFADAAACPIAALTALQGLRDSGKLQSGQHVLINGASGGVGTFAVQLAKIFGARVTAVCSGRNAEIVRSLGADRVIDYTRESYLAGTARYDLIFDLAGTHSYPRSNCVLTPCGIHIGAGVLAKKVSLYAMFSGLILSLVRSQFSNQKFTFFMAKANRKDLDFIAVLLSGRRLKSVIDRKYPLAEVPEAIRYQGTWRARGKLVIDIGA